MSARSLDAQSLGVALGLYDHCVVYFYATWAQHKSRAYLAGLLAEGPRPHCHFAFFVHSPQVIQPSIRYAVAYAVVYAVTNTRHLLSCSVGPADAVSLL
jgi:hypothetical protein